MVKVAHAVPSFSGIIIVWEWVAVGVSPVQRLSVVIVVNDVRWFQLIGHSVVCLGREIHPVAHIPTVIDDYICNGADTVGFECTDQREQFLFVTERTIVVCEPIEVVISHGCAAAVAALRQPDQIKILTEFSSLACEIRPFRVIEWIPVERLQHHTVVVLRPPFCCFHRHREQQQGCQNDVDLFHIVAFKEKGWRVWNLIPSPKTVIAAFVVHSSSFINLILKNYSPTTMTQRLRSFSLNGCTVSP